MDFKIGDVVQVSSGGPLMTIVRVPSGEFRNYECVYFFEGKPQQHSFPGAALKPYPER